MQHQNLKKIKSVIFQVGGAAGNILKKIPTGFEILNSAGTTLVNLRAAHSDGSDQSQVAVLGNVRDSNPTLDFNFAGAAPPSPGDNTDKYGFVHTAGGIYDAGSLVFDDGSTLRIVPITNHLVSTKTAITGGTIELEADSVYANESTTAPYSWSKKGDALGSVAGIVRDLTLPVTNGASTDSTTVITSGSDILQLDVFLTVGYDNAAVITFSVGAVTIGTIDGVDSAVAGRYRFTPDEVDVTADNPLNIAISNLPTVGALSAKLTWTKDQTA